MPVSAGSGLYDIVIPDYFRQEYVNTVVFSTVTYFAEAIRPDEDTCGAKL